MHYLMLLGAIGFEVLGTSLLKSTEGFTRLWQTTACLAAYAASFLLLAQAVRSIPVSVAYAMWSGLGTATIVGIGAMFLGEPITVTKVLGTALIVAGVVILNLGTT